MMSDCGCTDKKTLIYACSGGSNVGQITNDAAKELTRLGVGKMACVVGLAAHIAAFEDGAREADKLVVIDGCEKACAAIAVKHLGFSPDVQVIATDLGIEKQPNFDYSRDCVALVAGEVARLLGK